MAKTKGNEQSETTQDTYSDANNDYTRNERTDNSQDQGGPLTAQQLAGMTAQQVRDAVRGRVPSVAELRAMTRGESEDFGRFSDAQVQAWLDSGLYDVNVQKFHTAKTDQQGNPIEGWVDKPDDVPDGWEAWGENMARRTGQPGQPGGPNSQTTDANGFPRSDSQFTPFVAPSYEDIVNDPAFQFRLEQGENALQHSAAAKGLLRSGGTLRDILGYGQDLASTEYANTYNRALQSWQANNQNATTQYQGDLSRYLNQQNNDLSRWTTRYQGDLSRYLNRENNIFSLLNGPPPSAPSYS